MNTDSGQFFIGIVEDRNDPLHLGRTKTRVVGLHTHDKLALPTEDLPWAMLMVPAGQQVLPPAEGSEVVVIFNDYPECQIPIVIGEIPIVPQESPVNIDKFEPTPMWADDITPQGRPVPTKHEDVDGNQRGPVTGSNPGLASLPAQGRQESRSAGDIIYSTLYPSSVEYGALGGLAGLSGGIGEIYDPTRNAFENLLLSAGDFGGATSQLMVLAGETGGGVGALLAGYMDGVVPFPFGGFDVALSLPISGSGFPFPGVDRVTFSTSVPGIFEDSDEFVELPKLPIPGIPQCCPVRLPRIPKLPKLPPLPDLYLPPLPKPPSLDTIRDLIGLDNLPCIPCVPGPDTLAQIQAIQDKVSEIMGAPERIAEYIDSEIGVYRDAYAQNVGNIAAFVDALPVEVTFETFQEVEEGSTPPLAGAYGGPNFAGAEPVVKPPVNPAEDTKRYVPSASDKEVKPTPPDFWKGDHAAATQGIAALIAAADKYNFTNEQKAALLGIVGGECGWVAKEESCQYSNPDRLCEIFQTTFKNNRELAEEYSNWLRGNKGTKEEFFNFVYDTCNNGRQLGNIQPGDGGKFFGRGFIQLTGRSNYERYAKLSGFPLDTNPSILVDNPTVSAEVACLYFLDRVPKSVVPTAHPDYFYAAKKAVGNNSPDIAARKLAYYEYFYGNKTPEGYQYTTPTAGNTESPYSFDGVLSNEATRQSDTLGFQDPDHKYPRKRKKRKPQTSSLARGISAGTVVALKDSQRTTGVPVALHGQPWSQPSIPYGAKYPYNRVKETESGHIEEFDDTPGYERIHRYHRSGTFEEIDANGTLVRRIVGDGYEILDRNGFVSISGNCNVTIVGNSNILCQSDANIQVEGSAEMKIGGNFDIGVARDMNVAVQGNLSMWANGKFSLQAKKFGHIRTEDDLFITSKKRMHVRSIEDLFIESEQEMHVISVDDLFVQAQKNANLAVTDKLLVGVGSDFGLNIGGAASIGVANDIGIESANTQLKTGDFGITADVQISGDVEIGGNVDAEGTSTSTSIEATDITATTGNFGTMNTAFAAILSPQSDGKVTYTPGVPSFVGDSPSVSSPDSPEAPEDAQLPNEAIPALVHGMIPPTLGTPVYPRTEALVGPELHGEEQFMYELPSDGETPGAKSFIKRSQAKHGIGNTFEGEKKTGTGGGGTPVASPIQTQILSASGFTADYKLSKHFNLGMMFDGGFNRYHRLIAQNGLTEQEIVANLSSLCENILEKYLEVLPDGIHGLGRSWNITSGYRMGASKSDHNKGRAVDLALVAGSNRKELHYKLVQELDKLVPYDQLILEYRGPHQNWIHTSFRGKGTATTFGGGTSRGENFTMVDDKVYRQGFLLLA